MLPACGRAEIWAGWRRYINTFCLIVTISGSNLSTCLLPFSFLIQSLTRFCLVSVSNCQIFKLQFFSVCCCISWNSILRSSSWCSLRLWISTIKILSLCSAAVAKKHIHIYSFMFIALINKIAQSLNPLWISNYESFMTFTNKPLVIIQVLFSVFAATCGLMRILLSFLF